jgi:hypothetical protein
MTSEADVAVGEAGRDQLAKSAYANVDRDIRDLVDEVDNADLHVTASTAIRDLTFVHAKVRSSETAPGQCRDQTAVVGQNRVHREDGMARPSRSVHVTVGDQGAQLVFEDWSTTGSNCGIENAHFVLMDLSDGQRG